MKKVTARIKIKFFLNSYLKIKHTLNLSKSLFKDELLI
jgi:hypothetical protein